MKILVCSQQKAWAYLISCNCTKLLVMFICFGILVRIHIENRRVSQGVQGDIDENGAIFSSGTGGHVYPAYTLAKEYLANKNHVVWIGTEHGIENKVIDKNKITLIY